MIATIAEATSLGSTVVVLGECQPAGAMERIEVLHEPKVGVLLGLDPFVFPDEKAPLLHIAPFKGAVITIVAHHMPPDSVIDTHALSTKSVIELPDTFRE